METIRGKTSLDLDFNGFTERLADYNRIMLDLGTGDGRYVHFLANKFHDRFVIGVDSCRENLHTPSRTKLRNVLFVIASAQNLPQELNGLASHVTINFPWGSLLESLLDGDISLMQSLASISKSAASIDIRLNSGALNEVGASLNAGTQKIYSNMLQVGWKMNDPVTMNTAALRAFPSTWAKRLAFGRDPRAVSMSGFVK
ncbi:MAG: class I SAM-dependent methyltransferase [Chloroflexi bacterium]|nr:class I SAM-dependent methyltransferase [Chloroflexota bacterium]